VFSSFDWARPQHLQSESFSEFVQFLIEQKGDIMASIAEINLARETRVLAADTLTGDKVVNLQKEDLGKIEHLMIDLDTGRIAYAVLSFGGFLGMGDKLFAIPWSALTVDKVEKRFILNVGKELLKRAPGFDKDHWPNMADRAWGTQVFKYYGAKPYWD
jgi:sporulation protein YlmC with PRC-barrel domain